MFKERMKPEERDAYSSDENYTGSTTLAMEVSDRRFRTRDAPHPAFGQGNVQMEELIGHGIEADIRTKQERKYFREHDADMGGSELSGPGNDEFQKLRKRREKERNLRRNFPQEYDPVGFSNGLGLMEREYQAGRTAPLPQRMPEAVAPKRDRPAGNSGSRSQKRDKKCAHK